MSSGHSGHNWPSASWSRKGSCWRSPVSTGFLKLSPFSRFSWKETSLHSILTSVKMPPRLQGHAVSLQTKMFYVGSHKLFDNSQLTRSSHCILNHCISKTMLSACKTNPFHCMIRHCRLWVILSAYEIKDRFPVVYFAHQRKQNKACLMPVACLVCQTPPTLGQSCQHIKWRGWSSMPTTWWTTIKSWTFCQRWPTSTSAVISGSTCRLCKRSV